MSGVCFNASDRTRVEKRMALLEVKGLRRRFGGVTALDGADLTVEPGRITGLIGPNGAGKTTLFNAVTGALRPNGGVVTFDGIDVTGWRPDRLAGIGLSRTFQHARARGGTATARDRSRARTRSACRRRQSRDRSLGRAEEAARARPCADGRA